MINFFEMLLVTIILPLAISHIFNKKERYSLSNSNFSMLKKEKSFLDKMILVSLCETKNNKKKYIYFVNKYLSILTIIQIPWLIIVCIKKLYLNSSVVLLHAITLAVLGFIPLLGFIALMAIYNYKSKSYYKNVNKIKFNSSAQKTIDKQNLVYNAIMPYVSNPKKRDCHISVENLDKLKTMLQKEFDYAYTQEIYDSHCKQSLKVFIRHKDKNFLVIEIPISK